MEYISLAIAFFGFLASVYYSNKNSKRKDVEDIKKETERDVAINYKLDNLLSGVNNTVQEVKEMKKDLSKLDSENAAMSRELKMLAEKQKDSDHHLELLHREFREHVGVHEAHGEHAHHYE